MFAAAACQRFGLNQTFRLFVLASHFAQIRLFNVVQIFLACVAQRFSHALIRQDLMLQHAQFCQSLASRGAAARRHHGENIPAGDSAEMREAGKTLESAGKLLIVFVVSHV